MHSGQRWAMGKIKVTPSLGIIGVDHGGVSMHIYMYFYLSVYVYVYVSAPLWMRWVVGGRWGGGIRFFSGAIYTQDTGSEKNTNYTHV